MSLSKIRTIKDFFNYFPVVTRFSVHWGEMDAFKHVNNVAYVRYHESGRIAHFDKMIAQISSEDMVYAKAFTSATGIGPILSDTSIKYKFPLEYPETILLGSKITKSPDEPNKLINEHGVWGMNCKRLATTGVGTLVAFDYKLNRKADSFPECVLESFAKLNEQNSLCMLEDLEKEFDLEIPK